LTTSATGARRWRAAASKGDGHWEDECGEEAVEERTVSVPDFLATVCLALGIDPTKEDKSDLGRPVRITDSAAKRVKEVLA
jgi:hypothetical protein